MAPGDVWYHSWQAGGGYGDPLLREAASVAVDVARGAVSAHAARDIYGVALDANGVADEAASRTLRQSLRDARLAAAGAPVADGPFVLTGRGKQRYGDALHADFDRGEIACGHCGHTLGKGGEDLLPRMRELRVPLAAAGAVRGEDYDSGRFALRELCCGNCGGLIDVQVALDGVAHPGMRIDFK